MPDITPVEPITIGYSLKKWNNCLYRLASDPTMTIRQLTDIVNASCGFCYTSECPTCALAAYSGSHCGQNWTLTHDILCKLLGDHSFTEPVPEAARRDLIETILFLMRDCCFAYMDAPKVEEPAE